MSNNNEEDNTKNNNLDIFVILSLKNMDGNNNKKTKD